MVVFLLQFPFHNWGQCRPALSGLNVAYSSSEKLNTVDLKCFESQSERDQVCLWDLCIFKQRKVLISGCDYVITALDLLEHKSIS